MTLVLVAVISIAAWFFADLTAAILTTLVLAQLVAGLI